MGTLPEAVSVDTSCPYMAIQDAHQSTLNVIFLPKRRLRFYNQEQSWLSGCPYHQICGQHDDEAPERDPDNALKGYNRSRVSASLVSHDESQGAVVWGEVIYIYCVEGSADRKIAP